jgi:hypothetical protein
MLSIARLLSASEVNRGYRVPLWQGTLASAALSNCECFTPTSGGYRWFLRRRDARTS